MVSVNKRITEELRAEAGRLLESGEIAAFLGYCRGSLPYAPRPFVARTAKDAERLIWNSFCVINLANYIPGLLQELDSEHGAGDEISGPKVGVVATGCWSRNIVIQIQEQRFTRERVLIIGVSSRGMVDRKRLHSAVDGMEITGIEEEDHIITLMAGGEGIEVPRWNLIRDNCRTCTRPDPVFFDEMIGEPQGERSIAEPFSQVEEIESLTPDERWEWFQQEISSCIRCYACRNACPLCYCSTCFVDDSRPQWVGKSLNATDTALFHILRAFHCAGRCTDCGTCESVCPMGIKMRLLTKKLQKDLLELYDFEPGLDLETPLPLSTYRQDDPDLDIVSEPAEQDGVRPSRKGG